MMRPVWTMPRIAMTGDNRSNTDCEKIQKLITENCIEFRNEAAKSEWKRHMDPPIIMTASELQAVYRAYIYFIQNFKLFELQKMSKKDQMAIFTHCESVDELLNGLPINQITELVGLPGCGKTNICLQFCAEISHLAGAIYVDTRGNFRIKRLKEMCGASECEHSREITERISRVKIFKAHDFFELKACLYRVEKMLKEKCDIRLIVVDSIVFPFHCMDADQKDFKRKSHYWNKGKELNNQKITAAISIASQLYKIASEYNLAVVVTNEFTTVITNKTTKLYPCLGESFAYFIHNIIFLQKDLHSPHYTATLTKSSLHDFKSVSFHIVTAGIRDVPKKNHETPNNETNSINSKYNEELAQECLEWIQAVIGDPINTSGDMDNFYEILKDGRVLCNLVNKLQPNSVVKINTSTMAFKCMENISSFLNVAAAMGVPAQETFQTVDLWERQNLNSVVTCLQSLGRKAHKFGAPTIGPKEADKNVRDFSEEQLKAGQTIISLQYGSNKGATQSGINFGNTRHM